MAVRKVTGNALLAAGVIDGIYSVVKMLVSHELGWLTVAGMALIALGFIMKEPS